MRNAPSTGVTALGRRFQTREQLLVAVLAVVVVVVFGVLWLLRDQEKRPQSLSVRVVQRPLEVSLVEPTGNQRNVKSLRIIKAVFTQPNRVRVDWQLEVLGPTQNSSLAMGVAVVASFAGEWLKVHAAMNDSKAVGFLENYEDPWIEKLRLSGAMVQADPVIRWSEPNSDRVALGTFSSEYLIRFTSGSVRDVKALSVSYAGNRVWDHLSLPDLLPEQSVPVDDK
jgi:hypothetical protein